MMPLLLELKTGLLKFRLDKDKASPSILYCKNGYSISSNFRQEPSEQLTLTETNWM